LWSKNRVPGIAEKARAAVSEESFPPTARSQGRQVGDAIASVMSELTGRGPVSCRVIVNGDAVIAILHDSLTKGEQTLVEHGHTAEVLALRRAYQRVAGPAFVAEVQRITGRRVESFMSTNHAEPDRAAEIFLLDGPVDPDGPAPPAAH